MPGCSYDRARFAAMTIRFSNPNCTLLLFSSGKLVVTGVRSWYDGVLSCLHVARILQAGMPGLDFRVVDCSVQNIVAHVEVPVGSGVLNLAAMYTSLNLHCTYQDNLFPGLIYRPPSSPVVLLCFYSGKIVITGGKNQDDVPSRISGGSVGACSSGEFQSGRTSSRAGLERSRGAGASKRPGCRLKSPRPGRSRAAC